MKVEVDIEDDQIFRKILLDDWQMVKDEETGYSKLTKGPDHTYEIDMDGIKADRDRRSNGFKLFGKYYQNLWD